MTNKEETHIARSAEPCKYNGCLCQEHAAYRKVVPTVYARDVEELGPDDVIECDMCADLLRELAP